MASERGQASVEWVALLAVLTLAFAGLLTAQLEPQGTLVGEAIARKLGCAVRFGSGCGGPGELTIAYGEEIGSLAQRHAPKVAYERGMRGVPRDFRDPGVDGSPTAFTRVIDCREPGSCPAGAEGNLYLQYWFYYPDSYTAPWGDAARHPHDWESYHVRIAADGATSARASSHHGYDHGGKSIEGWSNQVGEVHLPFGIDVPLPKSGGWGSERGTLWVSDDSHAGRVVAGGHDRATPRRKLWLVPLEEIAQAEGDAYSFEPITPPWEKAVWKDPESKDT